MERYSDHFTTGESRNQDVAGFVYDLHRQPGKSDESYDEQNLCSAWHRPMIGKSGRVSMINLSTPRRSPDLPGEQPCYRSDRQHQEQRPQIRCR
jgi:hypothetical protein